MNEELKSKLIQASIILIIIAILIGIITIVRYFWPVLLLILLFFLIPKNIIDIVKEKFDEIYKKSFYKTKTQYNPENDKKNVIDAEIIDDD